eukprot:6172184-Pleurochrysis_carterae.AAC.3
MSPTFHLKYIVTLQQYEQNIAAGGRQKAPQACLSWLPARAFVDTCELWHELAHTARTCTEASLLTGRHSRRSVHTARKHTRAQAGGYAHKPKTERKMHRA